MFLVVGLGNPGKEYIHTRHNVGFDALDETSNKYNIIGNRAKFKGEFSQTVIKNEKVIFLKPLTYMNLSGESVKEVADYYNIDSKNIIVIYDDVDLEVGRLRIREKGSAGGHNGIKSIINCVGTQDFTRIRVGIGKATHDMVSHVLGKFSKEDRIKLDKCINIIPSIIETIISDGTQQAMNRFNSFKVEESDEVNNK